MSCPQKTVLILEDDVDIAEFLAQLLTTYGVRPVICRSESEIFQAMEKGHVALALLDIMLPETDGRSVAQKLRARQVTFPIYFMTGIRDEDLSEATRALADDILHKPFTVNRLKSILDRIFAAESATAPEIPHRNLLEIMANIASERETLRRRKSDLLNAMQSCSAQECSGAYERCKSISLALEASLERIAKDLETVLCLLGKTPHA